MTIPELISKYFMTCNSIGGKYTVEIETKTLAEAQELHRALLGILPWSQTLDSIESCNTPWNEPNCYGELPGDICCQRATGKYCYEHNKDSYNKLKTVVDKLA